MCMLVPALLEYDEIVWFQALEEIMNQILLKHDRLSRFIVTFQITLYYCVCRNTCTSKYFE
jgi:hypothetical protein